MKSVKKYYSLIIFLLLFSFAAYQNVAAQNALSPQNKLLVLEFEKRAKDYSRFREGIEEKLPQLPKEATAEQIETHKVTFRQSVQSARNNARQGEIFTPTTAAMIRKIIKNTFRGKDRVELRKAVYEAETKGVPLKINYPYPETKEKVEMPPKLLLNLPQLPKQLRYRFVGNSLLLVDRENGLIVDFMTKALP